MARTSTREPRETIAFQMTTITSRSLSTDPRKSRNSWPDPPQDAPYPGYQGGVAQGTPLLAMTRTGLRYRYTNFVYNTESVSQIVQDIKEALENV